MQCTNCCVSVICSRTAEISVQVEKEYALQLMADIYLRVAVFSGHGGDGS